MNRELIREDYFQWLSDRVCGGRYAKGISYEELLRYLHETEFRYTIPKDKNRAKDGIDLRYRFSLNQPEKDRDIIADHLDGPCSVLEMMVALAIRCEETIMDNPSIGDRTGQWFWGMVTNLGLGSMVDERFDIGLAWDILERFMDREYEPNGKGGLFTVRHCTHDLRDVEIWVQLLWYLDTMI